MPFTQIKDTLKIKVKNQIPMVHFYRAAEDSTAFLKYPHRHLFKITTIVEVTHEDRDIEFFALQSFIQGCLEAFKIEKSSTDFSCETLAIIIKDFIISEYKDRFIEIEVSEDGENSAILTHEVKNVNV